MNRRNKLLIAIAGLFLSLCVFSAEKLTVQADGDREGYDFLSSGVATVLDPSAFSTEMVVEEQEEKDIHDKV